MQLDAKDVYPDWTEGDGPSSYTPIYEHLGEVLLDVALGTYQGSTMLLLKKGGLYAYHTFGWGSCSGCDVLQACDTWKDLQELVDHVVLEVESKWKTAEEVLLFLDSHDWEVDHTFMTDEQDARGFLKDAKEILQEALGEGWGKEQGV